MSEASASAAVTERKPSPVSAGLACLLLTVSLLLFGYWMLRFGRVPVTRNPELLGTLYGFLHFWTTAFQLLAVAGVALGALALRRSRRPLAWAALAGNLLWLGVLLLLSATSA
jgi:hypothetical protein